MGKKSLVVVVILLIVAVVLLVPFPFGNSFSAQDSDASSSLGVSGAAYLLSPDRDVVSSPLFSVPAFIDPQQGQVVQYLRVAYDWEASGEEIDWTTLAIGIARSVAVYIPVSYSSATGQYVLGAPSGTVSYAPISLMGAQSQTGSQEVELDLQSIITSKVSVDQLEHMIAMFGGAVVVVEYKDVITASVSDDYGMPHTQSVTVTVRCVLEWNSVDFVFQVSQPGVTGASVIAR